MEDFDAPGIDFFAGEEARGESSSLDDSSGAALLFRMDFAGVAGSLFGAVTWDCTKDSTMHAAQRI